VEDGVAFRTTKASTTIPWTLVQEIKHRVGPASPASGAIDSRGPAGVVLTRDQKGAVLAALEEILSSDGIDKLGESGVSLRHELKDDLGMLING
jgi:hypothetical protein